MTTNRQERALSTKVFEKTYGEFTDGDLVEIAGEEGVFTFKYASRVDGEIRDISVVGPTGQDNRAWRSFVPSRLLPLSVKEAKKVSGSAATDQVKARAAEKSDDAATPAQIRAWAVDNGFELSDKGKIPRTVTVAFFEAHGAVENSNQEIGYTELVAVEEDTNQGREMTPESVTTTVATPDEIRTWARANGFEVGTRGRISADIRSAYVKANQSGEFGPGGVVGGVFEA